MTHEWRWERGRKRVATQGDSVKPIAAIPSRSVDGNINYATFGKVVKAAPPRIVHRKSWEQFRNNNRRIPP